MKRFTLFDRINSTFALTMTKELAIKPIGMDSDSIGIFGRGIGIRFGLMTLGRFGITVSVLLGVSCQCERVLAG